jgi:hypothetical protein
MEAVAAVVLLALAAVVLRQAAAAVAVVVHREPHHQADLPEMYSSGFSSLSSYGIYTFQNYLN